MKITFFMFFLLLLIKSSLLFSQVAINADGSNPNNSAMLDVKSNNKGFLPPRMTRAEMTAIPNPADGLIVYCTDCRPDGKGAMSFFIDGIWNYSITVNCLVPIAPIATTNVPSVTGIVWDWKGVPYATGYKWNILNDYGSATQMDTLTTKTETGLVCNTVYSRYVWTYNECGNSLPLTLTQTTLVCSVPALTTTVVSSIDLTTATSGGNISSDGGSPITARGVCWGTASNPTTDNSKTSNGTGVGIFTSNLIGLTQNTTYYVRAYATNSAGTGYGNEVIINTLLTDLDGNVYHTVIIGNQTWMVENLKTTKYRNGDPISNVTLNTSWAGLTTGAYCWYNNNAATYKATYGALYNWYAVADSRNIAPVGWHVATDAEWTTLTTLLGGQNVAGGKLKEAGTAHWLTPNTGATNSSGFTAFPGGYRYNSGSFDYIGFIGFWWSSTENSSTNAWYQYMGNYDSNVYRDYKSKVLGFSVRCLRD